MKTLFSNSGPSLQVKDATDSADVLNRAWEQYEFHPWVRQVVLAQRRLKRPAQQRRVSHLSSHRCDDDQFKFTLDDNKFTPTG